MFNLHGSKLCIKHNICTKCLLLPAKDQLIEEEMDTEIGTFCSQIETGFQGIYLMFCGCSHASAILFKKLNFVNV